MLSDAFGDRMNGLSESKETLAAYMASRTLHLSTIVNEPGFDQAVIAERNNVALKIGMAVAAEASAVDNQILGMIGGALRIAAVAMV